MIKILNYINGQLEAPIEGHYKENLSPSTGIPIGYTPFSDSKDVDVAVQHAKSAFPLWSSLSNEERSGYLIKLADLIDRDFEELAEAETMDTGKPLALSKTMDIPRASANFRFFATAILHFSSKAYQSGQNIINYTTQNPLGVVGCISPWNLPLYLFSWKIAPALAVGNTVVAKPSEVTPLTAYLFSKLCSEAGIPPGVINIVQGDGEIVGKSLVAHPDVKAISFTGGTVTGRKIASQAGALLKKTSLELGGKNPNIIFDDCDFDLAVRESVRASFANQGQICLSGSRIFIQEGIYEKFRNAFVEKARQLKVGDPFLPQTDIGAVVSNQHMQKILYYIDVAEKEGGRLLLGGMQLKMEDHLKEGYYIAPTIIEGLKYGSIINEEEIFGPVVTLTPFRTEEEVLGYANSSSYGLSATIWTENLKRAHRVAHKLENGIVWVNCWLIRDLRTPFGGMKNSGIGREGGFEALKFFTEQKNICITS